jgi:lysophospholipase L1-like esterase
VVRPSSIAAVEPTSRGTKARLHFVDTGGWLSTEDETFDGVHPTPKGAKVIARKLRDWLRDNGFLAES